MKNTMKINKVIAQINGETRDGDRVYNWNISLFEGAGNYWHQGQKFGIGSVSTDPELGHQQASVTHYGSEAYIQKVWKKYLAKYENQVA